MVHVRVCQVVHDYPSVHRPCSLGDVDCGCVVDVVMVLCAFHRVVVVVTCHDLVGEMAIVAWLFVPVSPVALVRRQFRLRIHWRRYLARNSSCC